MKAMILVTVFVVLFCVFVWYRYSSDVLVYRPHAGTPTYGSGALAPFRFEVNEGIERLRNLEHASVKFTDKQIVQELDELEHLSTIVRAVPDTLDRSTTAVVASLKQKLVETQVKDYPVLRSQFARHISNSLFIADGEANCAGNGNAEIELIAGSFAFASNVDFVQQKLEAMLRRLRFKRASYMWERGDRHPRLYFFQTDNDSALAFTH